MTMVLVVDDDPDIRATLDLTLCLAGYDVLLAEDGTRAVRVLESGNAAPDLVLLDYMMPGGDGIAIFDQLRTRWPDLPVIMLTAHATVSLAAEFMGMGGADFIEKPDTRKEGLLDLRIRLVLRDAAARRDRAAAETAAIAAAASARAKDGLLRNMGHSLRTVANHLQPALRGLARLTDGDERARPWLDIATAATMQIVGITDDLSDLIAVDDKGAAALQLGNCDVAAAVAGAADDCRDAAGEQGLALTIRSDLPPAMRIVADARLLQKAVRALLGLAIRSAAGGEVIVRLGECPEGIEFTIAVDGTLDDEERPFEVAADEGGAGAHGLDLALANAIIAAHDGTIRVDDRSGTLAVTVVVPAAAAGPRRLPALTVLRPFTKP